MPSWFCKVPVSIIFINLLDIVELARHNGVIAVSLYRGLIMVQSFPLVLVRACLARVTNSAWGVRGDVSLYAVIFNARVQRARVEQFSK